MGCIFTLVGLFFAFCLFYILVLPRMSPSIQYKVKMALYYFLLLWYGLIVTILAMFTPWRMSNYKYPMTLIKVTRYVFGLRIRIENLEKMHKLPGSYVVVSNHQSSIDLIGLGLAWPYDCTVVAKKSLMFAGWFGLGAWLCDCVFVSRGRESARRDMQRLAARVGDGRSPVRVWIFPEGTRHSGPELGEFKKGAFHLATQAQVPIVPVVFSSYASFYSSERGAFEPGDIVIRVLDPVPTAGKSTDDVAALTDQVRNSMNEVYGQLGSVEKKTD